MKSSCRQRRVFIAPAALGLGDLIVTLPVVQSLIAQGNETWLIVRSRSHLSLAQRINGLGGAVLEWEFNPQDMTPGDIFYDMRNHPLQKGYWWGSDEFSKAYPHYRINNILQHICHDLGIDADLALLTPLKFKRRQNLSGHIVFVPGSAFSFKCWPAANWLSLSQCCDLPVVVVGEPANSSCVAELIAAGLSFVKTPSLGDALDVISTSSACVAVDTGLMHLAAQQKVPTVALYRHNPVYLRELSHVKAIIAGQPCAPICYREEMISAHNDRPLAGDGFSPRDWSCASKGFRCMDSIKVAQVAAQLQSLLKPACIRHFSGSPARPPLVN